MCYGSYQVGHFGPLYLYLSKKKKTEACLNYYFSTITIQNLVHKKKSKQFKIPPTPGKKIIISGEEHKLQQSSYWLK